MGVTLPFQRLTPFGVLIDRDLSVPLAPSEAYHLRQLFNTHGLLVARKQNLDMAAQRALCAHLGPILDREGENGIMSNEPGGPTASELIWHADAAYTDAPFDALSLYGLDVVDEASSTLFIDAAKALSDLPADLADTLKNSQQEMISPTYTMLASRASAASSPEALKRGTHPCVMTNPHNNRECVWVSELQTARVQGMEWEDSRDFLSRVFAEIYKDSAVFEHRWRKGDLIIWDNIALQHKRPDLSNTGRRVLQRVIVGTKGVAPHVGRAAA